MNRAIFSLSTLAAVAALLGGCAMSNTDAPPLQGPSELGLSVVLAANPDTLSFDGASQSQIAIEARDANGQPVAGKSMRVEIVVDGTAVDFGSLSARTIVTGSNGRATVTYTSPMPVPGASPIQMIAIRVIPSGTDFSAAVGRLVSIRLVPPGVITGGGPTPSFTYSPATPAAFTDVIFDASGSTAGLGAAISSYSWSFGDGATGGGKNTTHKFSQGTFNVTLTVTDTNGVAASTSQVISIAGGIGPSADFTFSPSNPAMNQDIQFNGSTSRAGTGHTLVRYDWNFGSGSPQSGVTVTKAYDTAGTYTVTLTVTDEVGQAATVAKTVSIGNTGSLTASFTMSPSNPKIGNTVNFNGSGSTAAPGFTITSYAWDFGDGSTATGATSSHVYAVAATYIVRLTITDSAGRTTFSTQNLTVAP